MGLYDKLVGNATLTTKTDYIDDYLLDNEDVIYNRCSRNNR